MKSMVMIGITKVFAVLRNEPDRRCFLGVYISREAARRFILSDIEKMENLYHAYDYDVIETTVEE